MPKQTRKIQSRINKIIILVILGIALVCVTPVLADYLGPNRTVTETKTTCKIALNSCQYIASKDKYNFHQVNTWSCSNESKPWQSYPSKPPSQGCTSGNVGDKYWEKNQISSQVTTTYPAATISGVLLNCVQNNGWCTTAPQLSLSGTEPVPGYTILGLEGTWNGQNFACPGPSCNIPLAEGDNNFNYWALSSWTDTSTMGTLSAKVDSQQPVISGSLSGTSGLNGWYTGPVVFSGSASDSTSGLASFTCTLDSISLGSCNSITINNDGLHTLVLTAKDNAGLMRSITQNAAVDTQGPSLNVSLAGTRGSNTDWYTTASLNGSASDTSPGSGLSAFEYKVDDGAWTSFPSSGVLSLPDGKHTVDVRASDNAGYIATSSKSYWLDHNSPSLSVDPTGTEGANGWYISNLNLAASASDETSGLNTFEYSLNNNSWTAYTAPLILDDGEHNVSFWAEDEAGLVTQVNNTYKVDTHDPVIGGNLSGMSGENGWFISDVTLSASAFDPWPGSGLNAFTYILDNNQANAYTDPILLTDGQHTIKLDAQDNAGLSHTMEQALKVDTLPPSIDVKSILPDWVKDTITLDGTAGDDGSGLTKVEISVDGGQSWKSANGSDSWNYLWNTLNSPNGPYDVLVRAFDEAGLNTQQSLHIGVDNSAPSINLPASWQQWDTVTLDIIEEDSGLSETHLEISDPEGRWPARIISLDSAQFPMQFKWDRRFGDDSIAPAGKYDVKIIASDKVGNSTTKSASITVLIGILPPGPTATPLPPAHPSPTATVRSSATVFPVITPTQSVVVQTFGSTPVPGGTVTPQPQSTSTVRVTPTQNSVLDQFQSMFAPPPDSVENTTTIGSIEESGITSEAAHPAGSNVLWGATAAAVIGSMTAYALEEKRKQQEAKAEREALEAREEERHQKIQAQRTARLEAERAQERAWEEAREKEESQPDPGYQDLMDKKMSHQDAEDEVKWETSQKVIQGREAERAKELETAITASAVARQKGEEPTVTTEKKTSLWDKVWDWADQHQTEIALGIGIVAGVAAIVLSGGIAAPAVALAWTVGAAVAAAGSVAVGTVVLNEHYGRDWNENLLKNIAVAGTAAAVVSGGWFLLHAASTGVGAYCSLHQAACARVEPVLNTIDTAEELSLNAKLTYQLWRGDEEGASQTALDLQMEYLDGGMPGNSVAREIKQEALDVIESHSDEAAELIGTYGDDAIRLIELYKDDTFDFVKLAEKQGINPVDILYDPPIDDQSLEGWLLKITDPNSPVNKKGNLKLTATQIDNLLQQSLENTESNEFALGYFDPNKVNGYVELADKRKATKLSMPQSLYESVGFEDGTGDFWQVNRAAIQYGIDKRKTFVLSTDLETILSNPQKYTYAEIQMILQPGSGYVHIRKDGYDMLIPNELLIP